MSHQHFRDQVVLVTGASSGIGRALAAQLARQGAHVVLVARNAKRLHDLERQLASQPGSRLVAPADVTDPVQAGKAVQAMLARYGRVDLLINNAGRGFTGSVIETDAEEMRAVMEINFFGSLHLLQAVLPSMIERRCGTIVQVSSLNGFCAVPLGSAYCASKFALEALSQSLRLEVGAHGIHVLIVRPGLTDTEFFDNAPHFRERNPFPLRGMMSADSVARRILVAVSSRRRDLVLTREGRLLWWLKRLSPRLVDSILLRFVRTSPVLGK